ncbi:MAG: VapE family protein [Elusimicrobiales bacterium]|nr:VapE family protein [Elusimicrobiales bacterium]
MNPSTPATATETEAARRAAISTLAASGLTLFPLTPGGKEPERGCLWRSLNPGAYRLDNLHGNYGVALRACDLVIDVDPRNFKPGDKPHLRLLQDFGIAGKVQTTFIVRTGSGGLHIYLRKDQAAAVRKTLKGKYAGIDFLTEGCYVVGPGSIHPDTGEPYTIVSGGPAQLLEAPASLLAALKKEPAQLPGAMGEGLKGYSDDEGAQSRFSDYLRGGAPLAVQGENGDLTTYKVACAGRDLGLSPAVTCELMMGDWNNRCLPPWSESELRLKIVNAYSYAQSPLGVKAPQADFDRIAKSAEDIKAELAAKEQKDAQEISWVLDKNQKPVRCFFNLLNFFKAPEGGLFKVFGYNEFTANVEFTNPAPWHKGRMPRFTTITDHDLKLLKAFLVNRYAYEVKLGDLDEAISVTADQNRFHPVREYLLGLKWDGVERLDHWLTKYGHAKDTPYTRAAARKMICAAVARVFKPGCKFDHMLVLEGGQGIGKTQLCKLLGGEWYGDLVVDPHNKDTIASMQGKWVIEMSEMEVTRRTEMNALKAFISREIDKTRLAYGRNSQEYPRQCVFIGSINPKADRTYLEDTTGNRRFWPIELRGKVDLKGMREVRNQIYAEAVAALRAGETLYFDNDAVNEEARAEVAERHATHPWAERVSAWLGTPVLGGGVGASETEGPILREFVTARDVFIDCIGGTDLRLDRRACSVIADVMIKLGWGHAVRKVDGRSVRGYKRPVKPAGEEAGK